MKILSVVGTRPQFIKLALLSKELRKHFKEVIVHTGQHYDFEMSNVFFDQLSIPEPNYNLEVKEEDEVVQISKMMTRLEEVMSKEKPDLVLLFGDTNSTLAAALTASRLNLRCAHVESGTRMFDKNIPEEINRIVADNVSDFLFCPSESAVKNLKNEGFTKGVYFTGDVMVDMLMHYSKTAGKKSDILAALKLKKKDYILATIHRQSNTNNRKNLSNIFQALIDSKEKIIVTLHPRTRKYLIKYGLFEEVKSKLTIIKPVKYIDMLMLEKNSNKIITDSGGIQKEAYIFKVPCITLDNSTGWPETADDGWNILVGRNKEKILDAIKNFVPRGHQKDHYGNGTAVEKILELFKELK